MISLMRLKPLKPNRQMTLTSNLSSKDYKLLVVTKSLSGPYRSLKRDLVKDLLKALSTIFD